MTAGILVLAAGRSVRFGADKRLATLPDGQCVIEATLANVRASDNGNGGNFTVRASTHSSSRKARLAAYSGS